MILIMRCLEPDEAARIELLNRQARATGQRKNFPWVLIKSHESSKIILSENCL